MKVRSRKINDLDRGINHENKSLPAKARTQTAIVMGLFKVSSELPVHPLEFSLE